MRIFAEPWSWYDFTTQPCPNDSPAAPTARRKSGRRCERRCARNGLLITSKRFYEHAVTRSSKRHRTSCGRAHFPSLGADQHFHHRSGFCRREVWRLGARTRRAAGTAGANPQHGNVAADWRRDDGFWRHPHGLAAWHCHRVNQAIERGEVRANRRLIVAVTAGVAVLAVLMIVYMLLTAKIL